MKKIIASIIALSMTVVTLAQTWRPSGEDGSRKEVFVSRDKNEVHYRIPAIAALKNGTLIAVADYRFSGNDIGIIKDGRVDLRMRISRDNGRSWGEIFPLVEGKGAESPDFTNVAFGDPCIVADKKSGRVLVISCAGNVSFLDGQRDKHLNMVRFYSNDYGRTWSAPTEFSEEIYSLFDGSAYGPAKSMFFTSGRITQSNIIKRGKYYRLYAALLQIDGKGEWVNQVVYSDDFGLNWNVLGDPDCPPIRMEANEAKVEEMPDGSVIISSRTDRHGRNFNVFRYSNRRKAEGKWDVMAHSSGHNDGIVTEGNSCNGEMLIVPAIRNSDGSRTHLLLQSAPAGPKRSKVSIYYKEIDSADDYRDSKTIAESWDGVFRATEIGSAYSVMALQSDGKVGFMFEEKTYYSDSGFGYTIIYDSYSVEQLTGGRYSSIKK